MDFTFSDEQQQFRDALRRYLDREYAFDARQKIVASNAGVDEKSIGARSPSWVFSHCRFPKRRAASMAARSICSS